MYPYDKWASSALPDFDEGEQFTPAVCELRDGETSRPNLLTEADLVGLMDKNGIGGSDILLVLTCRAYAARRDRCDDCRAHRQDY